MIVGLIRDIKNKNNPGLPWSVPRLNDGGNGVNGLALVKQFV
jgi:hypothetical protein